jgi:hypothetical protein
MAFTNGNGGGAYGQPMSAAQKAAATRRANRAAGIPPKTSAAPKASSRSVLNNYRQPQASSNALILAALAAFETAMKSKLADDRKAGKLSPDAPKQFDTYQKLKALALGPTSSDAMKLEAQSALRMSMIAAIKLLF